MSPTEAADLAARTLAEIEDERALWDDTPRMQALNDADWERVASDLDLFRFAWGEADRRGYTSGWTNWRHVTDVAETNLRRTAALYGVTS